MKFRICLKDPDGVDCSLAAKAQEIAAGAGCSQDTEAVEDALISLKKITKHWFRYGESCVVEIDTEANSARVVPVDG